MYAQNRKPIGSSKKMPAVVYVPQDADVLSKGPFGEEVESTIKKLLRNAGSSIIYIRPIVIVFLKVWRSQLTFGFEKGRSSGRRNRPRVTIFCKDCKSAFL